jgi:hypothetical protein
MQPSADAVPCAWRLSQAPASGQVYHAQQHRKVAGTAALTCGGDRRRQRVCAATGWRTWKPAAAVLRDEMTEAGSHWAL